MKYKFKFTNNVSDLETSKALKKLGFNEPTRAYWQDIDLPFTYKGLKQIKTYEKPIDHNKYGDGFFSAPTEKQVSRFLKTKTI